MYIPFCFITTIKVIFWGAILILEIWINLVMQSYNGTSHLTPIMMVYVLCGSFCPKYSRMLLPCVPSNREETLVEIVAFAKKPL